MKRSFDEVSSINSGNDRDYRTNLLSLGDPLIKIANYLRYKEAVSLSSTCKFFKTHEILKEIIAAKEMPTILTGNILYQFIYRKNTLLGLGRNEYGQLGLGHTIECQEKPQIVRLPKDDAEIISIAVGKHHSIVLSTNGLVYSFGKNNYGQLGLGYESPNQTIPQPIKNLPKAQHIAAGYDFTIVSCNNKLYGFGENNFGQLGLDVPKTSQPLLITIPEEGNIKSIAVGSSHTLVLFENGKLWGFGANFWGQLGLGNIRKQTIPRRIELPEGEKVIAIAAGEQDTFVLCENSKNCRTLYGFGENNVGQLGLGHVSEQRTPQRIILPEGEEPNSIQVGHRRTFVLCENSKNCRTLYGFGENDVGQLGLGHMSVQTTPQRIILPEGEEPNSIQAGYQTTFVLCKSGIVYKFGKNSKDNTYQTTPQPILPPRGYKARSVFAAGDSHLISIEPEPTASLSPENQTSFSK
jgi:alpha-tubulin suppressor-like RCC1 family protein